MSYELRGLGEYELRGLGSLVPTDGATLPSSSALDQPATLRQVQAIVIDQKWTIWTSLAVTAGVILGGMYFIEDFWGRH